MQYETGAVRHFLRIVLETVAYMAGIVVLLSLSAAAYPRKSVVARPGALPRTMVAPSGAHSGVREAECKIAGGRVRRLASTAKSHDGSASHSAR